MPEFRPLSHEALKRAYGILSIADASPAIQADPKRRKWHAERRVRQQLAASRNPQYRQILDRRMVMNRRKFMAGLAAGGILLPTALRAQTPRTSAYLEGTSFPTAGPAGGIVPSNIQDFVASVPNISQLFNVKNYGATGNGTTNDTAAVQAAITAMSSTTSGAGELHFPEGTYLISRGSLSGIPSLGTVSGTGNGSIILGTGNGGYVIDFSGSSTSSVTFNQAIRDLQFQSSGGTATGAAIRGYYVKQFQADRLYGSYVGEGMFNFAQLWDSRFRDCHFIGCSDGPSVPVILIQNSAASSGFGYSTDNSNVDYFDGFHVEVFQGCGFQIDQGPGSSAPPNNFQIRSSKFENETITNQPFISIGAGVTTSTCEDLYLAGDSFQSGYSTPINCIVCNGGGTNYFRNLMGFMAGGTFATLLQENSGQPDVIDTLEWGAGSGPSVAVLQITGAQPIILNGVYSWAGGVNAISGGPTTAPTSGQYYAGTVIKNFGGASLGSIQGWLCTASGSPGSWRSF